MLTKRLLSEVRELARKKRVEEGSVMCDLGPTRRSLPPCQHTSVNVVLTSAVVQVLEAGLDTEDATVRVGGLLKSELQLPVLYTAIKLET